LTLRVVRFRRFEDDERTPAEDLQMSHGEYTKEDSRKDLSASLMGLAAGVIWVLIVSAISYFIAIQQTAGAATGHG
jgi:hypothetical protein